MTYQIIPFRTAPAGNINAGTAHTTKMATRSTAQNGNVIMGYAVNLHHIETQSHHSTKFDLGRVYYLSAIF